MSISAVLNSIESGPIAPKITPGQFGKLLERERECHRTVHKLLFVIEVGMN
jgi:hypothetical protein